MQAPQHRRKYRASSITAIDLFCGVGGLTHGFLDAGVPVALGIDVDPDCEYPYVTNNHGAKFLRQDIGSVSAANLEKHWGRARWRVLAGCAPCQPFSSYSNPRRTQDDRWSLLRQFGRLIAETQPDVVTMENVPQLVDHRIFQEFRKQLKRHDYEVTVYVVDCALYGVPQSRKRLVSFASKYGEVEILPPTHNSSNFVTVRETIADLPQVEAGAAHPDDPIHMASQLSDLNLRRIRASRPGGTWRDWPSDLVAPCHRKESGVSFPSVYGRMEWDALAPTMTTQCYGFGNGRFGHPEQDRAITLREAALLQTFPEDYRFAEMGKRIEMKNVGRLIGNAVPVKLGEVVARSITRHLGL